MGSQPLTLAIGVAIAAMLALALTAILSVGARAAPGPGAAQSARGAAIGAATGRCPGWQTTTILVIAAAVGVPLGIAIGNWAWSTLRQLDRRGAASSVPVTALLRRHRRVARRRQPAGPLARADGRSSSPRPRSAPSKACDDKHPLPSAGSDVIPRSGRGSYNGPRHGSCRPATNYSCRQRVLLPAARRLRVAASTRSGGGMTSSSVSSTFAPSTRTAGRSSPSAGQTLACSSSGTLPATRHDRSGPARREQHQDHDAVRPQTQAKAVMQPSIARSGPPRRCCPAAPLVAALPPDAGLFGHFQPDHVNGS